MSDPDDGTSVGIWYGAEETIVDEFDDHFSAADGASYSRSRRIKDAMALALAVDEALESVGAEWDIADHGTRATARQAIFDEFRSSD